MKVPRKFWRKSLQTHSNQHSVTFHHGQVGLTDCWFHPEWLPISEGYTWMSSSIYALSFFSLAPGTVGLKHKPLITDANHAELYMADESGDVPMPQWVGTATESNRCWKHRFDSVAVPAYCGTVKWLDQRWDYVLCHPTVTLQQA